MSGERDQRSTHNEISFAIIHPTARDGMEETQPLQHEAKMDDTEESRPFAEKESRGAGCEADLRRAKAIRPGSGEQSGFDQQ